MLKTFTTFSCAAPKAIAISSLLFATACSQQSVTKDSAIGATISPSDQSVPAKGNTIAAMDRHNHDGMNHGGMPPEKTTTTVAKLAIPSTVRPNTPIPLTIDIQAADGKPIGKFETFQEKLMHLIIVSDDLQSFSHLHPTYQKNGRFAVTANFPSGGGYTLVSDYKPTGQAEQVAIMKANVAGSHRPAKQVNFATSKAIGDIQATLKSAPASLKAGEEVSLSFSLKQKNGQPLTGLQPYLGEKGHLVIMKQSAPLTRADYIHAHAAKDGRASEIVFMTKFPQPGKYKMWGQFNHNGKIVVADFWVNIS